MAKCAFTEVIRIRGINPFVSVSAPRANTLKPDWRKPLPVLMRINGKPNEGLHTNMMPAGDGSFYLYLNGVVREASGTAVGDRVRVEVEFDAAYKNGPRHSMPAWLSQALRQNPEAGRNWDALIPSRKKEVLRYLAQLKSAEARARNLTRLLRVLSGETERFMARTWQNGS